MKKLLFIYNESAGKSTIDQDLCEIISIFTKGGYLVTAYPTQTPTDTADMIKKYNEQYDIITVSGGDGTLSQACSAMMTVENKKPIGYIPAGTTNDFATSFGISKIMTESAKSVVDGRIFNFDVGSFKDEYFCYVAAFGAFTEVTYETPQNIKNILGHFAYVLKGISSLQNIQSYDVTVEYDDGQSVSGEFLFGAVTNSLSLGGMKNFISQGVVFDDGLFEVLLIKTPNNIAELQKLLSKALVNNLDSKYFITFKASKVRFISQNELSWTIDGENGGTSTDVTILNNQKSLGIMLPK